MNFYFRSIAMLPAIMAAVFSQNLAITDYFNSSNRCDYLIFTPDKFQKNAFELALYRNLFTGDDIEAARYVVVGDLFARDARGTASPDSVLRDAIAWALAKWETGPSYIVFLGDDSARWVAGDSAPRHGGPMPTHITYQIRSRTLEDQTLKFDTTVTYDDDWYISVCGDEYLYGNPRKGALPAFGRIPCERPEQLSGYLEKVKQFDALGGAAWRNRALFLVDNDMQREHHDPVYHEPCAYEVMPLFARRFVSGLCLDDHPVGTDFLYPPGANRVFFSSINAGCGWMVYFGHGHPWQLTDERFIGAGDYRNFDNTGKPVAVFSMSCSNGAFYRSFDSSMCKQWLFSDGGAIIYFATPNEAYANSNAWLMRRIAAISDSLPGVSIGKIIAIAKNEFMIMKSEYEVLGDPAVRLSLPRSRLSMRFDAGGTLLCETSPEMAGEQDLNWEVVRSATIKITGNSSAITYRKRDTLLFSGSSQLTNGIGRILLPPLPQSDSLRITVYAGNATHECRMMISVSGGRLDGLPPVKHSAFVPLLPSQRWVGNTQFIGNALVTIAGRERRELLLWTLLPFNEVKEQPLLNVPQSLQLQQVAPAADSFFYVVDGDYNKLTLRRYENSGRSIWSKVVPSMTNCRGIKGLQDGGCLIWGESATARTSLLIRFDATGTPIWDRNLVAFINDIAETPSKNLTVTGEANDDSPYSRSLYLAYLSHDGDLQWQKTFRGRLDTHGNSILCKTNGVCMVAATAGRGIDTAALWILAVDANGDTLWSRTLENGYATSMCSTESGGFAVGGKRGNDGIVVLFDGNGTPHSTLKVPVYDNEGGVRLLSYDDASKGFLMAQSISVENGSMEVVGRLFGCGISSGNNQVKHPQEPLNRLFNVRVLAFRRIQFDIPEIRDDNSSIDIFTINGRLTATITLSKGATRHLVDIHRLAAGTYIARLGTSRRILGSVRFIVP